MHPPASLCGICLRRCSRIFTGLLSFIRQPSGQQSCGMSIRKEETLASVSSRKKQQDRSLRQFLRFSVLTAPPFYPMVHCQVKILDTSFIIYTVSPVLSNTPLLFFRSMYGKPTPAFFPYPLWIHPPNGCTCRRCMQLRRSCPATRPAPSPCSCPLSGASSTAFLFVMLC